MNQNDPIDLRLERIATRIRELGLEFPASLFLELHLPVTGLLHTSFLFAQPLVSPLFGAERVGGMLELFSDRKNVQGLIDRLEAKSES